MAKQNKKESELAKADAHKARLAEIKAKRRRGTNLERPVPSLEQKKLILIYCEGENTEPSYFKQFRLPTATIKVFGEGRNTLYLVEPDGSIN
ncbi:MAG: RloB domain-containing protein, partial [Sphingobacteriales bacterium]